MISFHASYIDGGYPYPFGYGYYNSFSPIGIPSWGAFPTMGW